MQAKFLGANWRTSLSSIGGTIMAVITWLSTVSYDTSPLAMVIPAQYKTKVTYITGICTVILWIVNGLNQKDKKVTGGSVAQTLDGSPAKPGTQTLVDITKETTEATEQAQKKE